MKKLALYVVGFSLLFGLVGCGKNKYVFESEKPYYGIVTDCAMSVVNEGDREGRAYVIISTGVKTPPRSSRWCRAVVVLPFL